MDSKIKKSMILSAIFAIVDGIHYVSGAKYKLPIVRTYGYMDIQFYEDLVIEFLVFCFIFYGLFYLIEKNDEYVKKNKQQQNKD